MRRGARFRTVLFDLGNVLVRFEPGRFWEHLGETDPGLREQAGPRMLDLGKIYEAGSLTTAEFLRDFRGLVGGNFTEAQVRSAFESVLPQPIDGMVECVSRISTRFDTALVSNTNPIHLTYCVRHYPVLRFFNRYYVSYEVGALKPSDDFYSAVVRGEGCTSGELLFIDDLAENVEGARRAGMEGVVFEGAERLSERLQQLGV